MGQPYVRSSLSARFVSSLYLISDNVKKIWRRTETLVDYEFFRWHELLLAREEEGSSPFRGIMNKHINKIFKFSSWSTLETDVTFNQSIPDHKYNLFRCSLFTYTMCIVCIVVVYKITILYCFKYIIQDTCIIQYLQLCNATALFRKRVKNVPVQM